MPRPDEGFLPEPKRPPSKIVGFLVGFLCCALLGVIGTGLAALWTWWAVKRRNAELEFASVVAWGAVPGLLITLALNWWTVGNTPFGL